MADIVSVGEIPIDLTRSAIAEQGIPRLDELHPENIAELSGD